ncbi:MAG: TfoX/Sxy family DNA transformation protein [Ruminococcus sp.]|nr:TfoX/Sxy family DNA transformation protein [Ruminococcus sp.]
MKLSKLPNIGEVLEKQLEAVGIDTPEKLREIGTEQVFLKLKAYETDSCFHKLTAIEGAVRGIPKKNISENRKIELKAFFDKL